ncbi:MAG TPA: hypothetical protein DD791_05685 [Syntrophomonas sp.]|jgi:cell wall-associated NlpC family hydrolase|nr:hypothetical protein [Syntrophomonas sp.]
MKKRVLAVMIVCIFTLGLMLTPAKSILGEPIIKVVSCPSQYLDNITINISKDGASDNKENLLSQRNSNLPLLTFPSGESITIPRYIDTPSMATSISERKEAVVTKSYNKNEPSKVPNLVSSGTQPQPITNVKSTSKPDIQTQAVTEIKTTSRKAVNRKPDLPQVKLFREIYNNSPAHALVGRAIWYMNYGYMVYGHKKYWDTGYIDCSNFVSLVYKDFGYEITSAARKYNTVGRAVSGVYSKRQPGSTKKYMLVGIDNLKPGDILTFWKEDSTGKRYIGHVAIYMGKLDGKPTIIHTVKGYPTAIGITTSFAYWYGEHFNGARRVLGTAAYSSKASYSATGPVIPAKYQMIPGRVIMPGYLPNGF